MNSGEGTLTLRALLPHIVDNAALVIQEKFAGLDTVDDVMMVARSGSLLMDQLKRSHVVNGEYILNLMPIVKIRHMGDADVVQLYVCWTKEWERQ